MKKTTIKFRIAVLITVLTALLSILMICFMVFISSSVVEHAAKEQLWNTVKSNIEYVTVTESGINLGDEFHFNQNGVALLIYSADKALLAGQVPVSFDIQVEFDSGEMRKLQSQDTEFLLLDVMLPISWEDEIWVRGLMAAPDHLAIAQNLLQIAVIAMVVFIFVAAIGTYYILDRSFKPLDVIISTASAINEAKDLSLRIDIPNGKDEFSVLARAFNKLFSRLERSFDAEKQFTSDASHELRTPISVIKSACDYSNKFDDAADDYKESIAIIERQAEKMSNMVSQLLSMSRIDQGTESVKMEKLELGDFVRKFCRDRSFSSLQFKTDTEIFVLGDRTLLERLLGNLVDNAYKYGKIQGNVWITVENIDNEAVLSVKDDGIGIEPEHQQKIWQRFYQVDPSRNEENGAGLGLSMVLKIAELHSGKMSLESHPEEGSCFSLHLPVYSAEN